MALKLVSEKLCCFAPKEELEQKSSKNKVKLIATMALMKTNEY